jgi:toxin ParE1/3/4
VPAAADRLVRGIIAEAGTLSTHPEIGRAGRIDGTRELIVSGTPYIVVYRSRNDAVEILAVFHRAGRWPDRIA